MITITKSRFARRSLVLCGVAGAAVIWLMLSLVNLQLVSPPENERRFQRRHY